MIKKGGFFKKGVITYFHTNQHFECVVCLVCVFVCVCVCQCVCVCVRSTQCATPPFFAGRLNLQPNFQKRGGLGLTSAFRWGVAGKEGVTFSGGLQFSHKNKLKSDIVNDKKRLQAQIFFFIITKHLNQEILAKNLVTFKR